MILTFPSNSGYSEYLDMRGLAVQVQAEHKKLYWYSTTPPLTLTVRRGATCWYPQAMADPHQAQGTKIQL